MARNCFSSYHPAVIFLYFAGAAGLSMCTLHPLYTAVSWLSSFLLLWTLKGIRRAAGQLGFGIVIAAATALINLFTNSLGLTVLFYIGGTPVTAEALLYGLCSGGMLASVLQWLGCYQAVMSGEKFLELFGGAFPTVSMMLSMVFRYIPSMLQKGREIRAAELAVTGGKAAGKKEQLRSGVRLASVLMNWSMENSMETADSMQAREYGKRKRSRYVHEKMKSRDWRLAAALLAMFTVSCLGVFGPASQMRFYPFVQNLETGTGFLPVYGLFLLTPVLLEIKEMLWWMRLR